MGQRPPVICDPWWELGQLTRARIALGRAGGSLPTGPLLAFQLAHARARDAVYRGFDSERIAGQISALDGRPLVVQSQVSDRFTYLRRPDLGRRLNEDSLRRLQAIAVRDGAVDLAIVVSDGLSATAVHRHAVVLLAQLLDDLRGRGWKLAPIVVARYGRVALEDEVGSVLRAAVGLILLGERPGLGAVDSLGAYLVYGPRIGRSDAERNCVSNIRPEGLRLDAAGQTILYLLAEARRRKVSGVQLKDDRTLPADGSRPAHLSDSK